MMGSDWYGAGGWMAGGWLLMSLGSIVFVLLLVWAVRVFSSSGAHPDMADDKPNQPTALDVLDIRFAKGEIGEEEYADKRRKLSGS